VSILERFLHRLLTLSRVLYGIESGEDLVSETVWVVVADAVDVMVSRSSSFHGTVRMKFDL
jgi:hypothetical protein